MNEFVSDTQSKLMPVIRISKGKSQWVATTVRLGAVNRIEPERHERTLTEEQSRELLAVVSAFGLWKRSDFAQNNDVLDGESWVVEGRAGTAYHPAYLGNSDREAIGELSRVFMKLAGVESLRRPPAGGVGR